MTTLTFTREGYKTNHYDYRGSTNAITNENGNLTDRIYYDPYGTVISRMGSTETPFLYVGKYGVEADADGLYYMRVRYYNPQIQRFINVDPIRDGYNWYGYVNNPIKYLTLNFVIIMSMETVIMSYWRDILNEK